MAFDPDIASYLRSGWNIVGFSTTFSESGVIFYSTLLRSGVTLAAVTIGLNRSREVYRSVDLLSSETSTLAVNMVDDAIPSPAAPGAT